MPEFGLSESLRESGIEEIRTLGLHIIIKHKNAGSFEIKIKENPFETGKSLHGIDLTCTKSNCIHH